MQLQGRNRGIRRRILPSWIRAATTVGLMVAAPVGGPISSHNAEAFCFSPPGTPTAETTLSRNTRGPRMTTHAGGDRNAGPLYSTASEPTRVTSIGWGGTRLMTTHSGRSSRTRRGTSESDGVSQVEKFSEDDLGWLEDPNREPELDDQGNWTDEEVERQAFMRRHSRYDPYVEAAEEEDEEDDGEVFEEIIANMTKPLGITIEQSTDKAELIYITNVGDQAENAGLEVGDVLTGVSAVFGELIWTTKGKTIEKVRGLVRCRPEPYTLLRVERGHVSLQERCQEGYGVDPIEDCLRIADDNDCEVGYTNLWADVYAEEAEVMNRGPGKGATWEGMFDEEDNKKKPKNEPPPKKYDPGSPYDWDEPI